MLAVTKLIRRRPLERPCDNDIAVELLLCSSYHYYIYTSTMYTHIPIYIYIVEVGTSKAKVMPDPAAEREG